MEAVEGADLALRGAQIWAAFSAGFAAEDETQRPNTQIKSKFSPNLRKENGGCKNILDRPRLSFHLQIYLCFYTFFSFRLKT